jgi:hypothetical protein
VLHRAKPLVALAGWQVELEATVENYGSASSSPAEDTIRVSGRKIMSTTATASRFLVRRPVWQVNYLAALVACVAVEAWGLAARAAGVPMRAASLGSHHATPITVGMFAMGTLVVTFWFTFAVVLIARFAGNPRRTYLRTALPLLVLSLGAPLSLADTAISTKLVLAAAHLIAAAIIIPVVARRLRTASRPD